MIRIICDTLVKCRMNISALKAFESQKPWLRAKFKKGVKRYKKVFIYFPQFDAFQAKKQSFSGENVTRVGGGVEEWQKRVTYNLNGPKKGWRINFQPWPKWEKTRESLRTARDNKVEKIWKRLNDNNVKKVVKRLNDNNVEKGWTKADRQWGRKRLEKFWITLRSKKA